MRPQLVLYGRDPKDPPSVLWRASPRYDPGPTLASGQLVVSTLLDSEDALRCHIMEAHPEVWDGVEDWWKMTPPPPSPACGRLFCRKRGRHGHRNWAVGDLFADRRLDPRDMERWPFAWWGQLVHPTEDELGVVIAEIRGIRQRPNYGNVRRLLAEEINPIGGPQ